MTRSMRRTRGLVLTLASAAALAGFGCGNGFSGGDGPNGGGPDDTSEAGADGDVGAVLPPGSGHDAGHADAADGADATIAPDDATADVTAPPADVDVPDTFEAAPPCSPTSLPAADPCVIADAYGVFVSSSLGSAAGTGAQASPFNTIAAAIPVAAAAKKRVYACAETYGEAITLVSNTSIIGYFDCAGGHWSAGTHHAALQAPSSPALTMNGVSDVRVEGLDVTVPSQAGVASGSSFGATAVGSLNVAFVDVSLQSAAAGAGVAGGAGVSPGGSSPCTPSDGASATNRIDGQPGTAAYSSQGYAPAKGSDGTAGGYGHAGTKGGTASCHDSGTCKLNAGPPQACLGINTTCGNDGANGCGGPGGAPGLGGTGGGSSIALFAWQSTISITGGALVAAAAGGGGSGGTSGAPPSTWTNQSGIAGGSVFYSGGCKSITIPCTMAVGNGTAAGGAAGGPGGQGAPGGYGAGGSGGDSYAYYAGGGATVTVSASTQLTHGEAGFAGTGTVSGHDGYSGAMNTSN